MRKKTDVKDVARLREIEKALVETGIVGIYDVFTDPADAITQMGLYVRELEARADVRTATPVV